MLLNQKDTTQSTFYETRRQVKISSDTKITSTIFTFTPWVKIHRINVDRELMGNIDSSTQKSYFKYGPSFLASTFLLKRLIDYQLILSQSNIRNLNWPEWSLKIEILVLVTILPHPKHYKIMLGYCPIRVPSTSLWYQDKLLRSTFVDHPQ